LWRTRAADDPARRVTLRQSAGAQLRAAGLRRVLPHCRHARCALESVAWELPLKAYPGARAEYSDPGFILLGKALEVLTGEALAPWVRREAFQPLGLTQRAFALPPRRETSFRPPREDTTFPPSCDFKEKSRMKKRLLLGGAAGHAGLFFQCARPAAASPARFLPRLQLRRGSPL